MEADKQQSKQQRLRKFQAAYQAELPQKFAQLEDTWRAIFEPSEDLQKLMFEFRRQVHSIAGSAGSFGYRDLGKQALQLELLLNQLTETEAPGEQDRENIDHHLLSLSRLAEQGPDIAAESVEHVKSITLPEQVKHLIYIIEDHELFGKEIAAQLQHYGYETACFTTINEAAVALQERRPSVMVVDVNFPEGPLAGPELARQFNSLQDTHVPVVFMSARDDWPARLAAVRAGGVAFIPKPFDFIILVDRLDHLLDVKKQQPYRILIVDDVPLLAEHYAGVLQAEGMQTRIVSNAETILEVLQDFKPELVLMDVYMPGVSGVEAATVIRQTDAYLNIPIVYLSTESGLDQQLEALRLGGDDFLQKPIRDEHLAAAVRIRVGRFRNLSAMMVRDSLTGLLNHIALKLDLEGAIAQAVRNKSPLSFAMLDIDHFKNVNDQYGHPVGDIVIKSLARLLQQRLRSSDVIGRYGGEEFAVVFPDTDPVIAKKVLDQLREDFNNTRHSYDEGEFSVSFSAGIACVPDYTDIDSLINAADEALYKAKHSGRNCIVVGKENH